MKSVVELGLKIRLATREYYRYTGVSAELVRCGAGSSSPDFAWVRRFSRPGSDSNATLPTAPSAVHETCPGRDPSQFLGTKK
jgi:hypothetical protein